MTLAETVREVIESYRNEYNPEALRKAFEELRKAVLIPGVEQVGEFGDERIEFVRYPFILVLQKELVGCDKYTYKVYSENLFFRVYDHLVPAGAEKKSKKYRINRQGVRIPCCNFLKAYAESVENYIVRNVLVELGFKHNGKVWEADLSEAGLNLTLTASIKYKQKASPSCMELEVRSSTGAVLNLPLVHMQDSYIEKIIEFTKQQVNFCLRRIA